jgi:EpsD family peptidyl-prolyl cis-trans isomerase
VKSTYGNRVATGLLCILALAACSKDGGDKGPIVLKVNNTSFSVSDLEREIQQEGRRAPGTMQQYLATKEGQKQLLEGMVRRELLLQEAEKRKLADRPEIAEQIAQLRRDLMIRTLLQDEVASKVKVEDKDVEEYFQSHPDEFSGDQVKVKHILVRSEAEAKDVAERLKKGEPFDKLARELSIDTASVPKGGELDYFSYGQMVPEFSKAAYALKPGEVSEVVKSPFGFHVIKFVDRKKGTPLKLDDIKEQLRRKLADERRGQRFQEWMKELQASAKITREESLLPVGKGPAAPPAGPGGGPGVEPAPGTGAPGGKAGGGSTS